MGTGMEWVEDSLKETTKSDQWDLYLPHLKMDLYRAYRAPTDSTWWTLILVIQSEMLVERKYLKLTVDSSKGLKDLAQQFRSIANQVDEAILKDRIFQQP